MTRFLSLVGDAFRDARPDGRAWRVSILVSLPMAILAYAIALLFEGPSGQSGVYDAVSYSVVAVFFGALWLALLARRVDTAQAVFWVITVVCVQFAGKLFQLLYVNPQPELIQAELTESFFWVPALYVLSGFVPGVRRGRAVCLGFFTAVLGLSVTYSVPNLARGENLGVVYSLFELSLANLTLLALTQSFIGFKDRFVRATTHAETMERLAKVDLLTDLPNRYALQRELEHTIAAARERGGRAAVLFLDIDHFKGVNDRLGHTGGDELLGRVARRIQHELRDGDKVFRISGDEFVIVLASITDGETAERVADRLRTIVGHPYELTLGSAVVSSSIGVSLFPDDAEASAELLQHADAAMYHVKRNGKNGVRRYSADDRSIEERASLVHDLRLALEHDELELAYQPIMDLERSQMLHVEALLRWRHAERGPVSPGVFVPLAEESGLITAMGAWVLKRACRDLVSLRRAGVHIGVSVNVSAVQFADPAFVPLVRQVLAETGLPPGTLRLEITETVVMDDVTRVQQVLHELRRLGVEIAIDDFGSGYSSLGYFETLDVDIVKIDRAFVEKLASPRVSPHYAVALIGAVMEIARTLDLTVVAEGIETRAQLDALRSLGVAQGQGFLFAKPMPLEEILQLHAGGSGLAALPSRFADLN